MRALASRVCVCVALVAGLVAVPAGSAHADAPTEYVEMSDGVLIAVNVQHPEGDMPDGGWPTIIQIDGYAGASSPMDPAAGRYGSGTYATVHMSLRGTACSGGSFDLFDRRSSEDGYEVIEWIADQEWSNGDVAIWGHSYSGLTGWLVASTQPPSLKAMSVSGLIADLYRGIVYMGGVSNLGFPLIWTGVYRPAAEHSGGTLGGVQAGDPQCIANQAERQPYKASDDAIVNGLAALGEDGQWWKSHSTQTYLDSINIPTHIVQSYQDEQTGPRGSNYLWQKLDEAKPDLPKKLLLTNGVHSTNTAPAEIWQSRISWIDCWLRGVDCGDDLDPESRVQVHWEMHNDDGLRSTGITTDSDWPLRQSDWTRYYLQPEGGLSTDVAPEGSGSDVYVSGSKRAGAHVYYAGDAGHEVTSANLPDGVQYRTEAFDSNTAFAGPITTTLFASSTAPDTEFFVELSDVDADGNVTPLQRGLLKASHRAIDTFRTDYVDADEDSALFPGDEKAIVRPYHPHTNTLTNLVVPGEVNQYDIEVFPVGHVFRPGHSLQVRITNPPQVDSVAVYIQMTAPGVNQIFHSPEYPSSILLPLVDVSHMDLGDPIPCGGQVGLHRCG